MEKNTIKAKDIKPYQNDIYVERIFSRMIVKDDERKQILKGSLKDLNLIISSDNFIIDGHHRWAMTYVLNPECEIICTQIKSPIKSSMDELKELSISYKEKKHKKTGKINIKKMLKKDKDIILDNIEKIISDSIENGFNLNGELLKSKKEWKNSKKFLKKLKKKLSIEGKPLEYLFENLKSLPLSNKNMERKDMPQIKKDDLKD